MNNSNTVTKPKLDVRQMTLTGLMAAIICILGPLALSIPISPVKISLCTMAIYFVVSVLGMKLGTLSVIIYILLGLAGVPVLSGFTAGASTLFGPTGGYMIGYIFMALICGFFVDRWCNKIIVCFLGMILGTAVLYLFGTIWLAYQMSLTFPQALTMGVIPFIAGDLVKLVIALLVGLQIRKRLVRLRLLTE